MLYCFALLQFSPCLSIICLKRPVASSDRSLIGHSRMLQDKKNKKHYFVHYDTYSERHTMEGLKGNKAGFSISGGADA